MKKLSFILLAILLFAACTNDEATIQEQDAAKLEKMHQEIITLSLATTQSCTDAKDWDFTPLGTKACGGVALYIPYSKKINKEAFLAKVKAYTDAQTAYDIKWNIVSSCELVIPPTGVECVDGKPKLSYMSALY
ncbi:hypothetical protein [Flavobacterium sp. YJ01]|uniref:hypothetical protein n=1 Tax=unclassified Flavobacterium TaxID=196869 RepID=UPI0023E43BD0|nr:hypothetical protein [Flavobacterium sp. YJ01]WET03556.1 hypothetical protein P0R33_04285 [Flavobacterium sp. YJ01]